MKLTSLVGPLSWSFFASVPADALLWKKAQTMVYNFRDIQPSPDLNWVPCFENFTCSVLQVPLDYANTSVGTTNVPFIKLPSANATAEDILFNPGGPGESGVDYFLSSSGVLQALLGTQHNLVSWDPRGVNLSSISLDCWPGNTGAKNDFVGNTYGWPFDENCTATTFDTYQLLRGYGQRCTLAQDAKQPKKYAGTVAVVGDMLRYIELAAKLRQRDPKTAKLWYYGASYGTVLGQTFASLYPKRVGRMILDGVSDADEHYAGGNKSMLKDTDAAFASFFKYCFAAGPQKCVFAGNATSAADLEARFYAIIEDLQKKSILLDTHATNTPTTVGWRDLKLVSLLMLYKPLTAFPAFAHMLVDLKTRNGTLLGAWSGRAVSQAPVNNSMTVYTSGVAGSAITCVDQAGRFELSTFDMFEDLTKVLVQQSWVAGTFVATGAAGCAAMDISPPASQLYSGRIGSTRSATPILFSSNLLDPVTPLKSAQNAAAKFAGSGLVTTNGTGHCAISIPSKCLAESFQNYLVNLTLPSAGTVCQPAQTPFL